MASVPLTLHDVYGDQPVQDIVDDVYGDGIELLIGHLDQAEVTRRLARQPWWRPWMRIDTESLDHAWVTWDEHAPGCDRPDGTIPGEPGGDGCDCTWSPWIVYHWHDVPEGTPDAVAVTFVELDNTAPPAAFTDISAGRAACLVVVGA